MKFRPLHDRLLVERLEEEQKSKGGIFIPDSAKEKPSEGKILAVGPGKMNEDGKLCCAMGVKVGDRILFGKYAGTEIKLDGKDNLLVLREEDVLGVLH
jgi:chaperonin GroES